MPSFQFYFYNRHCNYLRLECISQASGHTLPAGSFQSGEHGNILIIYLQTGSGYVEFAMLLCSISARITGAATAASAACFSPGWGSHHLGYSHNHSVAKDDPES